jgi:hypothetical protein
MFIILVAFRNEARRVVTEGYHPEPSGFWHAAHAKKESLRKSYWMISQIGIRLRTRGACGTSCCLSGDNGRFKIAEKPVAGKKSAEALGFVVSYAAVNPCSRKCVQVSSLYLAEPGTLRGAAALATKGRPKLNHQEKNTNEDNS